MAAKVWNQTYFKLHIRQCGEYLLICFQVTRVTKCLPRPLSSLTSLHSTCRFSILLAFYKSCLAGLLAGLSSAWDFLYIELLDIKLLVSYRKLSTKYLWSGHYTTGFTTKLIRETSDSKVRRTIIYEFRFLIKLTQSSVRI